MAERKLSFLLCKLKHIIHLAMKYNITQRLISESTGGLIKYTWCIYIYAVKLRLTQNVIKLTTPSLQKYQDLLTLNTGVAYCLIHQPNMLVGVQTMVYKSQMGGGGVGYIYHGSCQIRDAHMMHIYHHHRNSHNLQNNNIILDTYVSICCNG